MRIAFIVGKFPSISETFILNQITGLIDAGHEVDIFAFKDSEDSKEHPDVQAYNLLERTRYIHISPDKGSRARTAAGIFSRRIFSHPSQAMRAVNLFAFGRQALSGSLLLLLDAFREQGPYHILNCHFGKQGLQGMYLKRMGIPGRLVVNFHGYDVSQLIDEHGPDVYGSLFRTADLLLPVSQYWQRKLVSLGAEPERVRVHHMGIDVDRFEFKPRVLDEQGEVRLFTVGRLVEKKGIEYSILAVARLVRQHPEWKLRYDIMGDGPMCEELDEMVERLGLGEVVHLLGSGTQEDVQNCMQEAHLFLLPSVTSADGDQEGIPVSMMEAMAAGMPVISSQHSGIPELVEDGVSGYLVPERDVDGIADRLEAMIAHPEAWVEMGRAGRSKVEQEFNIHSLNHELEQMYSEMVSQASRPLKIKSHL